MKTLLRRGALGLTAGALSVVGLMPAAHARAGVPVPDAEAGSIVAWGDSNLDTVPDSLTDVPVTAIAGGNNFSLALKSDGTVTEWGTAAGVDVPDGLSGVTAIAAGSTAALALKSDGTVVGWGAPTAGISPVPDGLTGVISIDIANGNVAAAVKSDGTVVEWGSGVGVAPASKWPVPDDVSDVRQVAIGALDVLALKTDGTVVTWGNDPGGKGYLTVPTDIQGHVVAVAAGGQNSAALLDDGTVRVWGADGATPQPAGLTGQRVTDIDVGSGFTSAPIIARTESGQVFAWGGSGASGTAMTTVPGDLDGQPVAAVAAGSTQALALVTSYRKLADATITGTPRSGQILTLTPATFSLDPDDVATQWFADGDPIDDATGDTLTLTDDEIGKQITAEQTATRGSETLTSDADAVGPVAAAQATSTLTATAQAGAYGTATTVTVKATPGTATGAVQVSEGSTALGTGTLSNGTATVTIPGTALAVGTHSLTVGYAGDDADTSASTTVAVTVAKANAAISAKVKPKKPTKAKLKKAKAKIAISASGYTPTGTVTIYLKNKKVATATLSNGKATLKLKKLKKLAKNKRKLKLQTRYSGDTNTNTATTNTTLKLKH